MKPVELLEIFSIDVSTAGAADFLELAHRIAAAKRGLVPFCGHGTAKIADAMRKERGISLMVFYARIKQAVKPILETDDATLRGFGLVLPKRTGSALAVAVAELMLRDEKGVPGCNNVRS